MSLEDTNDRRQALETQILEESVNAEGQPRPPRTRGERQLRQLLIAPVTDGDVEETVENDEECLVWRPCRAPCDEKIFEEIGEPHPMSQCFACQASLTTCIVTVLSINLTQYNCVQVAISVNIPIHNDDLKKMERLMEQARNWQAELQHARNIQKMYEETIRQPSLKRTNVKFHCPEWSLATIFEHMRTHVRSPEAILAHTIQKCNTINNYLYDTMWSQNMANPNMRRINIKKINAWHENTKVLKSLMVSNPAKCFGYDRKNEAHRHSPYGQQNMINKNTHKSKYGLKL